jgi:hypothetical protein
MLCATGGATIIIDLSGKIGEKSFALGGWLIFIGVTVLLVVAPYLLARGLLVWVQDNLSVPVHATVLSAFFGLVIYWAWLISGDRGNKLFRTLYTFGIKWAFLFSIALLLFATLCFASLSSILSDLKYVEFDPAVPAGEFWRIQDFYMWHFLNSVPGLKIPETLLWDEPMKHKDHLSGVLLLAYKLLVIIPVIGSFAVWNKMRKTNKPTIQGTDEST